VSILTTRPRIASGLSVAKQQSPDPTVALPHRDVSSGQAGKHRAIFHGPISHGLTKSSLNTPNSGADITSGAWTTAYALAGQQHEEGSIENFRGGFGVGGLHLTTTLSGRAAKTS